MKKFRITFICCCIILLVAASGCGGRTMEKQEYLRIHVRANSNLEIDQSVKYEVRDEVVNYLTPIVENVNSKQEAIELILKNESAVKRLIDEFLIKKGFNYRSRVEIRNEKFPTRVYEDLTLEAGYYDALIIELGEGKGDNWWCVVYPPLCFTGGENVKYRSKIYELINGLIG